MGFNADLADMADTIDEELGEPATWSDVAGEIRVHFETEDQRLGYGPGEVVARTRLLMVHRSQVPQPEAGETCTLIESGEILRVIADSEPLLDRDGYWGCEVESVQP